MKLNKKGFTLIELLAVIVILGVLLAIAVPAVTKYISSSRKSTYITNVKEYMNSVSNGLISNEYQNPIGKNEATVVTFSAIYPRLERGGSTSPYDGVWDLNNSFVLIVNTGSAEEPQYDLYVAASDSKGYTIGEGADAAIIEYDSLKSSNVIQTGAKIPLPSEDGNVKLANYSDPVTVKKVYTN